MILNWISVKDKLPKESATYIVYTHWGPSAKGRVWCGNTVVVADYILGMWWYCNRYDITNNVTHWMPLPEPPRMEEETNE